MSVASESLTSAPRPQRRIEGVGVGLRSAHYAHVLSTKPQIPWFEATSENYLGIKNAEGGRPLEVLRMVRRDYPIILHGVSLNIGSADPLDGDYLRRLKVLADQIEPEFLSDHLCWTGVGGENLHDLLPLPFTEETLRHVVARIAQVQDIVGRRFAFENVSSYLSFAHSEMSEWEFIREIALRADCQILLDINNIHVSATNQGFNGLDFIRGIPQDRVAYFHLAGYSENGPLLIDTHDHPVTPPVWDLYAVALRRFGARPTMIEWDDKIPAFDVLCEEARKAEHIQRQTLSGDVRAALR